MAFGIGINRQASNAGKLRGTQKEIACQCWFTSTGKLTPLMIKVQDENGEIQRIDRITVHSSEKKNYAGIPSIEYDCTLHIREQYIRAWLIYYQAENRWVLNFRQ